MRKNETHEDFIVRKRAYYQKTKERQNELRRARYHTADNKKQFYANTKKSRLKLKYGISPEDYAQMSAAQDNKCFLCDGVDPSDRVLSVDHCHKSGEVRKLLCGPCNRGIGLLKDNPELLRKAAHYIETHGGGY